MELAFQLFTMLGVSAVTSGVAVWLFKAIVATRLHEAVKHEYSQKLQEHKKEMDSALAMQKKEIDAEQKMRDHLHDLNKTRTELFFDDQRTAFMEILESIAALLEKWDSSYQMDTGLMDPVPRAEKTRVEMLISKFQLFLDSESIAALKVFILACNESLPFCEYPDGPTTPRDAVAPSGRALYLHPRLAALFQKKIGVGDDANAIAELGILGAIVVLRRYRMLDRGIFEFIFEDQPNAEDVVKEARGSLTEFIEMLEVLESERASSNYLSEQHLNFLRTFRLMIAPSIPAVA